MNFKSDNSQNSEHYCKEKHITVSSMLPMTWSLLDYLPRYLSTSKFKSHEIVAAQNYAYYLVSDEIDSD